MDSVDQIPVGILHVLKADIPQDTSVVEQDIDAAEGLDGGLDDCFTVLDAVVVGNGLAAGGTDFLDDIICSLGQSQLRSLGRCAALTFPDFPSPLCEPPRSLTTTLAPLEEKNRAYAFPKPPPAPVTTTVWLSNRSSDIMYVWLSFEESKAESGRRAEEGELK